MMHSITMNGRKCVLFIACLTFLFALYPQEVSAMHIAEGYLPGRFSLLWSIVALPFIIVGGVSLKRTMAENPQLKILLAMAAAFAFVVSSLKLPSVAGSSSHATGIGLGAILFGPSAMAVVGLIVLIFQALLLAHGGITTLGANTFSMAIAGPFLAYFVYRGLVKLKCPNSVAVFCGASLGNLFTYVVTSIQLGLAFPAAEGGVLFSIAKFMGIFAVTQIPLALVEGFLTVLVFNIVAKNCTEEMKALQVNVGAATPKKRALATNILLLLICVILVFVPFYLSNNDEFVGTDDQGTTAIEEINENYTPWFASIFEPTSDTMEILLFSLQTALGAGVLGFVLGRVTAKRRKKPTHTENEEINNGLT